MELKREHKQWRKT